MKTAGKALVIGSSNLDIILNIPRYPRQGESLPVHGSSLSLGGKGANRATAMSRLNSDILFYCKLGRDTNGDYLYQAYEIEGLPLANIIREAGIQTGTSYILLEESGSNTILINMGANATFHEGDITTIGDLLDEADYLCIDLEWNMDAVEAVLNLARKKGVKIVVDAGPIRDVPLDFFQGTYILSPNETEAQALTGLAITDRISAEAACEKLHTSGCRYVVMKWGANGSILYDGEQFTHFPAFSSAGIVQDTTGAGDCFTGALTARLVQGESMEEAIRYATVAAAVSVTRLGASSSMPAADELDKYLYGE